MDQLFYYGVVRFSYFITRFVYRGKINVDCYSIFNVRPSRNMFSHVPYFWAVVKIILPWHSATAIRLHWKHWNGCKVTAKSRQPGPQCGFGWGIAVSYATQLLTRDRGWLTTSFWIKFQTEWKKYVWQKNVTTSSDFWFCIAVLKHSNLGMAKLCMFKHTTKIYFSKG